MLPRARPTRTVLPRSRRSDRADKFLARQRAFQIERRRCAARRSTSEHVCRGFVTNFDACARREPLRVFARRDVLTRAPLRLKSRRVCLKRQPAGISRLLPSPADGERGNLARSLAREISPVQVLGARSIERKTVSRISAAIIAHAAPRRREKRCGATGAGDFGPIYL